MHFPAQYFISRGDDPLCSAHVALWWYVVGSIKSIKWWRDLDISKTHTGLYLVKKKNCNTDWHYLYETTC